MSAEDNKSLDDIQKEQDKKKKELEQQKLQRELLLEHARELEEEKKNRPVKLKTRPVPAVITLLGGAVAAIAVCILHYPLHLSLMIILGSLLLFLVLGDVIKISLDRVELPPEIEEEEGVGEDGEMIEKGPAEGAETENIDSESDGTVEEKTVEEDGGF